MIDRFHAAGPTERNCRLCFVSLPTCIVCIAKTCRQVAHSRRQKGVRREGEEKAECQGYADHPSRRAVPLPPFPLPALSSLALQPRQSSRDDSTVWLDGPRPCVDTTLCAALDTNAEARKSPLSPKKKDPKPAHGSPRGPGKAERYLTAGTSKRMPRRNVLPRCMRRSRGFLSFLSYFPFRV